MEPCYKTFISVGNAKQHFSRLLKAVVNNINLLPKPILIQRGHTNFDSDQCKVIDFVSMDQFIKYILEAQILILHAGAGSVLHAIKSKKMPILMPRLALYDEHINDHQLEFANVLQQEQKAILVNNEIELGLAIQTIKDKKIILNNSEKKIIAINIIRNKIMELLEK